MLILNKMWSKGHIRISTLLCFILSLSTICSSYVITTPRRWTEGEENQVCVILSAPAASEVIITFEMKSIIDKDYYFNPFFYEDEPEPEEEPLVLIEPTSIIIPEGERNICQNIFLPPSEETRAEFTIFGFLEGQEISYTKSVRITSEIIQTFIQTDKYLYKPSQIVQFRILTVMGPLLQVSYESYEEIYIESPSGIRLAQWLDVENNKGLIHLSFQLADEPEEGKYKIKLLTSSGRSYNRAFKVEEYVLPRFEVTINPPSYILGSTDFIIFEVCATYTFGQPVNGYVSITVSNGDSYYYDYWNLMGDFWGGGFGSTTTVVTREGEISGCASFNISADELDINSRGGDEFYTYNNVYSLYANAFVIEEGTGTKLEANEVSKDISRAALNFEDISVQKYYKPELPYVGEVKVTFPDDSPAFDEPMTVCCEDSCKNMSTDADGILKFAVPPHLDCDIRISAPNYPEIPDPNSYYNKIMYKSGVVLSILSYYSPSNSSLKISLPNEELECSSTTESIDFDLPVMFAVNQQESAFVTVQIVSRGQIQVSLTFDQTFTASDITSIPDELFIEPIEEPTTTDLVRGSFTVPITLPKTVSPEVQILVWYERYNGEVVSDTRDVSIMECLLNSVTLSWSTDKALPGANATVSVTTEPMSLCSLGVVDKSVQLLTPKKYLLTIKRLLKMAQKGSVREYDGGQVNDYEYCNPQETVEFSTEPSTSEPSMTEPSMTESSTDSSSVLSRKKRSLIGDPWYPFPTTYYTDYVDAIYMFDEAGLYVMSDLTLETRPCDTDYDYWNDYYFYYENYDFDNYYNFYYYGNYDDSYNYITGGLLGGLDPLLGGGLDGGGGGGGEEVEDVEIETSDIRTYFPETWLWDIFEVPDGLYEDVLTLPDTVTEWVGSAVCVHPSLGIGISSLASIITFKEFFVDLTLPPSVKRGEIFPVKISIFNFLNESLPIRLILESPEDQFDILSDADDKGGKGGKGDKGDKGDKGGKGVRTVCVPEQDKTVISIRIRAKEVGDVNISVQAIVQKNAVENCGSGDVQQKDDYLIQSIRVNFEGFVKEETHFEFVCTDGSANVSESWNVTAPDGIVPDSARGFVAVVGDLMGPTLDNLGNLVHMPYGCGEQNMINFAPNIFVIQYLNATNQITADIADEAIGFMEYGYQAELKYRHIDGSYSAFGKSDESGSTWLTAFVFKCFAQASPYITIDLNELNITKEWLLSKQLEDGCFESVGNLLNKAMQGGVDSNSPSLLTAYVLIALIEAGESIDSQAVSEALFCIDNADTTTNPYSLAIKAYAYALSYSPNTQATIDQLLSLATTSFGSIYWEYPNQYEFNNGIAVETASYAVLAILTFTQNSMDSSVDYSSTVVSIIKWINTQRNGQGGFKSTQDTVMALQALAAFQTTIYDVNGLLDLTVLVTMGIVTESFTINEENKLLQQSIPFPEVPTTVIFDIDGHGCVLLQSVLRYNIPYSEANEAFSLSVTSTTEPDDLCKTKRIKVCVSYLLEDEKSNMAIIEIDLISGYVPVTADLEALIEDASGLFKRYEIEDNTVAIYVDKLLTSEEICLSFRIRREVDVENPKPGTVIVYDYYILEYLVSETYILPPPTDCVFEAEVTTVNVETTTN